MAPPLKLTPRVHTAIVESVRNGSYLEPACHAAGIDDRTAKRWIERAADPKETDERFARFARAIAQAEAEAENDSAKILAKNEDWRARAWHLSRRWSQRWSEKVTNEHVGAEGGPIQTETTVKGVALTDVLDFARHAGAAPSGDD